jgi:hypothetical protein
MAIVIMLARTSALYGFGAPLARGMISRTMRGTREGSTFLTARRVAAHYRRDSRLLRSIMARPDYRVQCSNPDSAVNLMQHSRRAM